MKLHWRGGAGLTRGSNCSCWFGMNPCGMYAGMPPGTIALRPPSPPSSRLDSAMALSSVLLSRDWPIPMPIPMPSCAG